MKKLFTAAALTAALAFPVLAQDAKPTTPPVAAPSAPAAKVEAPKVTVPAVKVEAPKAVTAPAAPAVKVEAPKVTTPAAPAKVEAAKPATPAAAPGKTVVKPLNLNTATSAELDALPKIGEARTKAIIAGRPYKSVDDLIAKKVIPQDAFDAIKTRVVVK